jgi:sortase A
MNSKGKRSRASTVLIIAGSLLLLAGLSIFIGLKIWIWSTNREASEHQARLMEEWESHPQDPPAPGEPSPPSGSSVTRIEIPRIGLDAVVVELSGLDDLENLKKGPGHVPGTAYPGQEGNVVISGHRTTYGAPFNRVDELQPGDLVLLHTASAVFTYSVERSMVVQPTDLSVLDQSGQARLTLTSCHPEFRATQRIVVVALLTP